MIRKRNELRKAIKRKIIQQRNDRLNEIFSGLKNCTVVDLDTIQSKGQVPLEQLIIYSTFGTSDLEKDFSVYLTDKDWIWVSDLIKGAYSDVLKEVCLKYCVDLSSVNALKNCLGLDGFVNREVEEVRTKNISNIRDKSANFNIQIAILFITFVSGVLTLLQFLGCHAQTVSNAIYK